MTDEDRDVVRAYARAALTGILSVGREPHAGTVAESAWRMAEEMWRREPAWLRERHADAA